MLLGAQLRRLREARGISREQAGHAIRGSGSKLSRLELGRVSFKARDVADLLTLYGVTDESERAELLAMVRDANRPGWWHRYGDILSGGFEAYVGLEEAATRVRTYEVQVVPGLMQTEDYARALIHSARPETSAEEADRRVELLVARQQLLTRANPPRIWAVVDEAALRRPVGGPAVMRAQLQHLIELTALPQVTLQVMPFRSGGHAAVRGPFTILRFEGAELPDVVYVEQLTSALYLDKRDDLDRYSATMESLCRQAEAGADAVRTLRRIVGAIG
jgi:transcriptional regulator with XRE-family HTH domain